MRPIPQFVGCSMTRSPFLAVATLLAPALLAAQSPVAAAFRENAAQYGKNLVAASETMPADKYGYNPTPAQMSFADIAEHLAKGNDYLCGAIGGVNAPERSNVGPDAGKEALIARSKTRVDDRLVRGVDCAEKERIHARMRHQDQLGDARRVCRMRVGGGERHEDVARAVAAIAARAADAECHAGDETFELMR